MAMEAPPNAEPNLTTLVAGIINDAQNLFHQQVELVRTEIQGDLKRTKDASQVLAIGAGAAIVAVILLALMCVHLLAWATTWPLWICYGVVGGVLGVIAGAFILTGVKKFQSFNPLPDESLEGLKENLQWKTNPT